MPRGFFLPRPEPLEADRVGSAASPVKSPAKFVARRTNMPAETERIYRDDVRGIVSGYRGHVPNSRNVIGNTYYGGPGGGMLRDTGSYSMGTRIDHADDKASETEHGGMPGYRGKASLGHGEGTWSQTERGTAGHHLIEHSPDLKGRGVVTGYAGFIPGRQHKYGTAHRSKGVNDGIYPYVEKVEGRQVSDSPLGQPKGAAPEAPQPESYCKQVNGILPGYRGHMPRAREVVGETFFGGLSGQEGEQGNRKWEDDRTAASEVHGDVARLGSMRAHSASPAARGVLPGYRGHVPTARDKFGGSHYFENIAKDPAYRDLQA